MDREKETVEKEDSQQIAPSECWQSAVRDDPVIEQYKYSNKSDNASQIWKS
jgi:hypothetical protein